MTRDRELERRQMESPGVLFFRVLVMLACLILVPLAAIFGSAFPELVKTALVDRVKEFVGIESESSGPGRVENTSPQPGATDVAPAWNAQATPEANRPVAYAAPFDGSQPVDAHKVAVEVWESSPKPTGADDTSIKPSDRPAAIASQPPTNDHFTEIQHRLRGYGAVHYALETAGNQADLYRFHCKMPIPGSSSPQSFEAIDRDPLRAMHRVLIDVEAWRTHAAGGGASVNPSTTASPSFDDRDVNEQQRSAFSAGYAR